MIDLCVVYVCAACTRGGQGRTLSVLLYHYSLPSSLETRSLTGLGLGWWPASLRDPPASSPAVLWLRCLLSCHAALFSQGCWILLLAQEALLSTEPSPQSQIFSLCNQSGLQFTTLLFSLKCWDHRYVLPYPHF